MSTDFSHLAGILGGDTDLTLICDKLRRAGQDAMAADIGAAIPTDERRICGLTGTVAMGYAHVPRTDVPLSHGSGEPRPTAFQRWMEGARPAARAVRVGNYWDLRMGHADHGTTQGAEAPFNIMALREPGAMVEFDYLPGSGDMVIRRRKNGGA